MCMTAVRPLKRKCSLSTESANKMLELSTIDSFATLHLGDNTAKSTYKVNPNSNNASELGKNMSHSCGRRGSSSSSSSSCSDEMQFKMSPQAQSINCGQKPCKIGFKNWKENEKVKEEKRKFIDIVRRRIRTTSLRSEDEQKYSNSSKKSTSKTRDDGFRRGSDGESLMRPRSRTIASPADISLKKLPTVFRWEGTAQQVFIAGSFDNWKSKTPMIKSNDEFYTIIDLPQGDYQYKFLIDGQWQCDPHATISMGDNGVQNNVVSVRESDFEVFEALAVDSVSNGEEKQKGRSGSPVCDYTQEIPTRSSLNSGLYQSGPPVLPPHLLQVILNREVPLHCEPTLLPEPNHVMLNHLYALSIRDGVMVLSSTHRFRKKYVTTLLYRPV